MRYVHSAGGDVVGWVVGKTFHKRLLERVHKLRSPSAWCFDVASLDEAEELGATEVELTAWDTGRTYWAAIATIRAQSFPVDRGFGEQVGLAERYWRVTTPGGPEQLALWGEG